MGLFFWMSMPRSYFGCSVCRQRKVKCNEVKPACGPCSKANRQCSYSENFVFRHCNFENQDELWGSPLQHESISSEDQVWVEVPRSRMRRMMIPLFCIWLTVAEVTFIHITDPYEDLSETLHSHELQREASKNDNDLLGNILPDTEPGFTPGAENSNSSASVQISPAFSLVDNQTSSSGLGDTNTQGSSSIDVNLLSLHLIRQFIGGPGQWMDLFDTGAYFSRRVPILAQSKPVLKSAICALAAKHVDRLRDPQASSAKNTFPNERNNFQALNDSSVNWKYKSVEYYDKAINSLEAAIELYRHDSDAAEMPQRFYPEDITAAVAILCMYELMDSPGEAWNIHLNALPLFSSTPDANYLPLSVPRKALRAPVFWNLARQDYLSALINETQTRLNLQDMQLWHDAGLIIDSNGFLTSLNSPSTPRKVETIEFEEDNRGYSMLWLVAKIVNFVTAGDAITPEDYARPEGQRLLFAVAQEDLLRRWKLLEMEMQKWLSTLPLSFIPSARTPVPVHSKLHATAACLAKFGRTWYELPICAAIMQSYHMAHILLLVNRPYESTAIRSTVSARLRSYRQTQEEVVRHGREICNISLADPPDSVRIHSVQPLFVAGQALSDPEDRQLVIDLLASIEEDLGWGTSYHRNKLTEEWHAELENVTT